MYDQCDLEGQQYLLFGPILDHKTYIHALFVAYQDLVVGGQSSKCKNKKMLELVCPMEEWDNNMGYDIGPQGIPSHSGLRVLTCTWDKP